MLSGLYGAASALEVAGLNHELIAENLAHATTPGYRRQALRFDVREGGPVAPGAQASGAFTYFESGPVQHTGSPLDLALSGNGFFALEGPEGPVYTRSGAFQMNGAGELVNSAGLRVSGEGGPIRIPAGASRIDIGQDGTVAADGNTVGRVRLVTFENPAALRRVGVTLFAGAEPSAAPPGAVRVEQGYREGSNVQVVQEMVSMMLGLRHYEAAEKAMRAISDAVAQNSRPQG